ncbi:hypothetical protein HU200_058777 [Digitaria exilis]|uniref:VQ domain-containing protein n=1 Tax=Digitaria exilis TaxID=1010633 RepID=A0A835DYX0_9POAL|nr:hypothetical protein HU200_058777 [Digitaria exilis]
MAAAASFDATDFPRHGAGTGPLGVHAASRKIGKSPGAERKPVIIYMVSPKVIHVEAHEFLPLVQRLTGPDASAGAAGRGDKNSTSGGSGAPGSSSSSPASPRHESENNNKSRAAAPPVRVKARALNRPAGGPAVSVSVTATRHQQQAGGGGGAPSSAAVAAASPSGFMFHDLSPLRGAALKGEHPLVSPAWLHHVSDHFLSPGGGAAGSPSAASFLDIFGPLPSQQQ